MMVRASVCALALLLAVPAAAADPAVEAALEADDINQEHCASLYTGRVDRAASATMAVALAWQRVDQVYSETEASYLLFWRGVLAHCLGREEAAAADLTEFVEGQSDSSMFASLIKQAETRLRRLGEDLGQGGSARFLRLGPALEVGVSWSGGSGFHELACTDATVDALNVTCVPDDGFLPESAAALVPASVQLHLFAFPARPFGLGARLAVHLAAPSGLPTERSPGPTLQIQVGPQLRLLDSVAAGRRSGWFRAEAGFAASFTRMSPMAGQPKYQDDLQGFLDPGSWDLKHVGVAARLEGAVELSPKVAVALSGRFAWYAPMAGSHATRAAEPGPVELSSVGGSTHTEEVEILPELQTTSQMSAGGRVGLLLPVGTAPVAVGPFVAVDFLRATMTFPNDPADCWQYGGDDACGTPDIASRKVFSSRRHDLYVTAGIEARFGAPGKE
jgi:hypothetical protein